MNVMVFGGGVYIGSHMCKFLIKCGNMVFVVDNFTTGFPLSLKYGQLSLGDIQHPDFLDEFFAAYSLILFSILQPTVELENQLSSLKSIVVIGF